MMQTALAFMRNRRIQRSIHNIALDLSNVFLDLSNDSFNEFELDGVFILLQCINRKREWYIFPRSTHGAEFLFSSTHFMDCQFMSTFRMSRTSFYRLYDLLRPHIEKQTTSFRVPIPSERRLAIFLYHISLGASYQVIMNQFGCGKGTVSIIIGSVAQAILCHLTSQYIRFSTIQQAARSMDFWRTKSGIPGVVACIDGCHIPIVKPADSGTAYFNRKGFYSINIQSVSCSSLLMISCSGPS